MRFGLPQSKQTTEQSLRHNLHATQQTYRSVYDHRERCTLPSENNLQNHRLDELSNFHYIHQPDVRSKQIASKLLEYHENKGQKSSNIACDWGFYTEGIVWSVPHTSHFPLLLVSPLA